MGWMGKLARDRHTVRLDASVTRSGLIADNRGVAAIEYAFLLALIALSLLIGLTQLGNGVGAHYNSISSAVEDTSGTAYQNGSGQGAG